MASISEVEALALTEATRAARAVAERTSPTPAQAAMDVMCAYLVARAQLDCATQIDPELTEDQKKALSLVHAVLKNVGIEPPVSKQVLRFMQDRGVPLLLTVRPPSAPDAAVRPSAPRRDGVLRSVWRWIARRTS